MQIQLNQDSTNFSVPFLPDSQLVKKDTVDINEVTIDSNNKDVRPKKVYQTKNVPQVLLQDTSKEIAKKLDTKTIFLPENKEEQVNFLNLDSLEKFLNFSSTVKQKVYFEGLERKKTEYDSWQWIAILLAIALIGITRALDRKRFSEYLNAIFNRNASIQITRNEKVYGHRANIFLTTAYFLLVGLVGLQLVDTVNLLPEAGQLNFYGIAIIILILSYTIKISIHKILASILSFDALVDEYVFAISLYNIATLFLLLPTILISSYGPPELKSLVLTTSIIMIGVGISARIIRGLQIGINSKVNIIYLFLYLCTLEILPLIIVSKALIN